MSLRQQEENLNFIKSSTWKDDPGFLSLTRHSKEGVEKGFILDGDGFRVYVGDVFKIFEGNPPERIIQFSSPEALVQAGWLVG